MKLLYLDTNIFSGRMKLPGNPGEDILQNAQQFGFKVMISNAVYKECRQKAVEKIDEVFSNLEEAIKKCRAHLISFEEIRCDREKEIFSYEERLNKFIKQHEIETFSAEFPTPTPEEMFDVAVKKQAPFGKDGQSFRDGYIFFSIIHHLSQLGGVEKAVFVTQDTAFAKSIKNSQFTEKIQTLHINDVPSFFEKLRDSHQKSMITDLIPFVEKEFKNRVPEIKKLAMENLPGSRWLPPMTLDFKVNDIRGIENTRIDDAEAFFQVKFDGRYIGTRRPIEAEPNSAQFQLQVLERLASNPYIDLEYAYDVTAKVEHSLGKPISLEFEWGSPYLTSWDIDDEDQED